MAMPLAAMAFNPGAVPVTAAIEILAVLLALSALLALGLLRALWLQRQRLGRAERQLRQQARQLDEGHEAERRALATERQLRDITGRIPVAVFVVRRDADRRYRLAFLAGDLHALFGLDASNLQEAGDVARDWPLRERIHPEDQDALRRQLRQATRHRRTATLDFRAYGAEQLRWIHMVLAPHREADGRMAWAGYCIDTTYIQTHNQALRAARDAAERASKAKADFLATMSHEIRTPMNGVIGMLELLGHTRLDADQQELLRAVEDSAGVLLQILNDVLDFSKLEAGNLRLDPAPFDPRVLVDNVVGLASGTLRRKGLRVSVAMDAALAGRLLGDGVRIRQILLNLLNNAGKFTERGSVAVALRVLGDDGQGQRLRLSVADTGIGIAADKQASLFTPFAQAETWTARRYGGTGLGLAICRHLVQLMDGEITLSSEPGAGTTVTVELKLPIVQRPLENPHRFDGQHAVLRLSAPDTAAALEAHLQALGFSVESLPPPQPLRHGIAANLLFVDAADHDSPAQVPARVVAVVAVDDAPAMPYEQDERILLGADPLKWQAVVRACVLAQAPPAGTGGGRAAAADAAIAPATAVSAPATTTATATAHPARPGRILVAEDHPVNQALARRQLALLGWPCDVAGDGRAAYEALCRHDYALLMTDCQMPVMDGYALAAAWRRHEAEHALPGRLPIIAMTAHALGNEIARCREAGMDDYLSKPVQLQALEEKILAWLPQAAAPTAVRADTVAPPLRGDMLRLLLETSRADLEALGQATAGANARVAAQWLHRLLGALQVFVDDPAIDEGRHLLDLLEGDQAHEAMQHLPAGIDRLRGLLDRMEQGVATAV